MNMNDAMFYLVGIGLICLIVWIKLKSEKQPEVQPDILGMKIKDIDFKIKATIDKVIAGNSTFSMSDVTEIKNLKILKICDNYDELCCLVIEADGLKKERYADELRIMGGVSVHSKEKQKKFNHLMSTSLKSSAEFYRAIFIHGEDNNSSFIKARALSGLDRIGVPLKPEVQIRPEVQKRQIVGTKPREEDSLEINLQRLLRQNEELIRIIEYRILHPEK
jgi:hypothetical protein